MYKDNRCIDSSIFDVNHPREKHLLLTLFFNTLISKEKKSHSEYYYFIFFFFFVISAFELSFQVIRAVVIFVLIKVINFMVFILSGCQSAFRTSTKILRFLEGTSLWKTLIKVDFFNVFRFAFDEIRRMATHKLG